MKGLLALFLGIVFSGIGWSYCSEESRKGAIHLVRRHLLAFIVAVLSVAIAIFVSTNTTLRIV